MTTTATVKHLHMKRRMLREVTVFAELLLWEAELHITPLRASDVPQKPVFFVVFFSTLNLVSQLRRFQTMINA